MKKLFFAISLFFIFFSSFSQITKIRGKIIDAKTKEPIPFVNVIFKGTQVGTVTDFNGNYFLEARVNSDSLIFTSLGYNTIKKKIANGVFQTINLSMETGEYSLAEVIIKPTENPAFRILRKIVDNKYRNNPDKIEAFEREAYTKIEIDVNNISEKFKSRKLLKQFKFIFDYMDTSAVTGKAYLPVFISENLSNYYFRKSPRGEKELIKATQISGIENKSISQFTGSIYQDINMYDNFFEVFGKSFVSPISNQWHAYYKYYLLDSAYIDNTYCYHLSFKPKRKQELTFTGDMWVTDTTFALKKIEIRIAEDANINFVNDLVISHEYKYLTKDTTWVVSKEQIFSDFNLNDKSTGFFGRKTSIYNNYILNKPKENNFYSNLGNDKVDILSEADVKSKEYWDTARFEKLSDREANIYYMVDTIKKVPIFRTYLDIVTMIISGYKNFGKIELGPYYKLYSYNEIEGHKPRLGIRTSTDFSTRLFLEGYGAYGLKDEKFKYGVGAYYYLTRKPYSTIGFNYKDDMEQLGSSSNSLTNDNIFSTILRREANNKLTRVKEFKFYYDKEWFPGLSNRITFNNRVISALGDVKFNFKDYEGKPIEQNTITTSEVIFKMRFAHREKFIEEKRGRTSLGSKFPIIQIQYTKGVSNVLNSNYDYNKFNVSFSHYFKINPIGYTEYLIEYGKIFDRLPYPLLELHKGNETYFYDETAFNMMNYFEFVSDEYASVLATHHFNGWFFNKMPLLRKLKLREVVFVRGLVGRLSDKNKEYNGFNKTELDLKELDVKINELSKPYVEVGAGIENIFKILRIDALWRLSYLDHKNISPFGIRTTIEINF